MATDKASKALEGKANTSSQKQSWQEFFARNQTVSARAIEAAEAVRGLAGSWTAFSSNEIGIDQDGGLASEVNVLSSPASITAKTWKIGQPGVPEINFPPYHHGSNRFASKGPGYLGHPIGMSVVGPTLKSPLCDWQWTVTDNSAIPGSGDILAIDQTDSTNSTAGGGSVAPNSLTIANGYNFSDLTKFPGGLYLVITHTGALADAGNPPIVGQGLGDGYVFPGAGNHKKPISAKTRTAKYEIFRIVEVRAGELVLDPNKRIKNYFDIPNGVGDIPSLRAVTIFEPHVTRLVGLPSGNGPGKETTFVVVPPVQTANADYLPPYNGTSSWLTGGFDAADPALTGGATYYAEKVATPIPVPKERRMGRLPNLTDVPAPVAKAAGLMTIISTGYTVVADDVGKILHVYRLIRTGTADLNFIADGILTQEATLGWFEVVAIVTAGGRNEYTVRRIAEVDPQTGRFNFGSALNLTIDDTLVAGNLALEFTVHDPISSLHTATHLDLDAVDSVRLQNLIDPAWVERSSKQNSRIEGSTASRADKAIWDTTSSNNGASGSNANPGSLLDLGFRMVLYPAKAGAGVFAGKVVPDYAKPITSRDVVLDPTSATAQSLDIDYASGLVTLSTTPVPGAGCTVAPNGVIANSDNPRNEIVLFAACMPYTMEEGQRGGGLRVVSSQNTAAAKCANTLYQSDVYSERVSAPVLFLVEGVAQVLTSGVAQVLDLAESRAAEILPDSGFVELRHENEYGTPVFSGPSGENFSIFGYYKKTTIHDAAGNFDHVRLVGVWGGGNTTIPDTHTVIHPYEVTAVLRRDLQTPVDVRGLAGVPYEQDSTYGFAKRTSTLHLKNVSFTPQPDGSLQVAPYDDEGTTSLFQSLFRSWLITGGVCTAGTGLTLKIAPMVVLMEGRRSILPGALAGPDFNILFDLPDNTTSYVILTPPTNCPALTTRTTLPVPSTQDILLAKVVTAAGAIVSIQDLRNPLTDTDKRLDIVVGQAKNVSYGLNPPHFLTLAEAVAYCSEIMDPTNGDNGNYLRIKVVGYTDETATPIQIKTNGLIIEGAGRREDGSAGDPTFIQWSQDRALFDLNGKADLTFENLAFSFKDTGQAVDNNPDRVVFKNAAGGFCNRLHVKGCTLQGNSKAHGFMYLTGGGARHALIEDCAWTSTDFGIYVDAFTTFEHNLIRHNDVVQTGTAQTTSVGGIVIASTVGFSTRIQDNRVLRYAEGIRVEGFQDSILSNRIENTIQSGIHVKAAATGGTVVRGNTLATVFTQAGAKLGIWVESGPYTRVEDNNINISGSVGTDKGIQVDVTKVWVLNNSAPALTILSVADGTFALQSCVLQGNFCGAMTTGDGATITDNILTADLTADKFCIVKGNRVDGKIQFADPSRTISTVANNMVTGDLELGEQCLAEGNQLSGNTSVLKVRSYCMVTNNICALMDDSGATHTDVLIQNNYITSTGTTLGGAGLALANSIFKGNRILCTDPAYNVVAGDNNVVSDNIFEGALATAGNACTVSGNIVNRAGVGTDLFVNGENCTVFGNKVTGDLTVLSTIAGPGQGCVLTGNHLTGVIAGSPNNVKPPNTIVNGNRVPGGFVFLVATPVANDPNG